MPSSKTQKLQKRVRQLAAKNFNSNVAGMFDEYVLDPGFLSTRARKEVDSLPHAIGIESQGNPSPAAVTGDSLFNQWEDKKQNSAVPCSRGKK